MGYQISRSTVDSACRMIGDHFNTITMFVAERMPTRSGRNEIIRAAIGNADCGPSIRSQFCAAWRRNNGGDGSTLSLTIRKVGEKKEWVGAEVAKAAERKPTKVRKQYQSKVITQYVNTLVQTKNLRVLETLREELVAALAAIETAQRPKVQPRKDSKPRKVKAKVKTDTGAAVPAQQAA